MLTKIKNILLVCIASVVLFTAGILFYSKTKVEAVSAGETATFTGILEKHTNPKYTHRLAGTHINLILNAYYNQFEGKEVSVNVEFTNSEGAFKVKSITTTGSPSTPSGEVVVFKGKLVKHENTKYTHKLDGTKVNLILTPESSYEKYLDKDVEITVKFTTGAKFRVLSVKLIEVIAY